MKRGAINMRFASAAWRSVHHTNAKNSSLDMAHSGAFAGGNPTLGRWQMIFAGERFTCFDLNGKT